MEIWDKLINTHKKSVLNSANKAWVYTKGGFSFHNDFNFLKSSNFLAAILISKDVAKNITLDHINAFQFDKYKLLLSKNLDSESTFILKTYWPLIVDIHLKKEDSPFILVHMAITLDGKIATECGHSKWIGNKENLIHAHRLRAIVDGILVGANTVKNDNPQLNVRHVRGDDPVRLILSNQTKSFKGLNHNNKTKTFLIRNEQYTLECEAYTFDKKLFFSGKSDADKMNDILLKLRSNKIKSILIEGGAKTISSFTTLGLIDTIQLHIAPMILGSGKTFVNLPKVSKIQDGISIKNPRYETIGDSIMITGKL